VNSAVTEQFDDSRSDVDFLVEFPGMTRSIGRPSRLTRVPCSGPPGAQRNSYSTSSAASVGTSRGSLTRLRAPQAWH